MARTRPYANDVERFAIASGMLGLTPSVREQHLDFELAADAAWEDFQRDVGINPFLAEASDTTRYYDCMGGRIVQIHPYFSITAVYALSGGFETTSEGQTLVTDYLRMPDGETPTRYLEFYYAIAPGPRRIGVTGRRGWTDDLPARVFQAVCWKALASMQPSFTSLINNGAISWQEGDVSEKYGEVGAFVAAVDRGLRLYQQVTAQEPLGYRQVQVYGAGRL